MRSNKEERARLLESLTEVKCGDYNLERSVSEAVDKLFRSLPDHLQIGCMYWWIAWPVDGGKFFSSVWEK